MEPPNEDPAADPTEPITVTSPARNSITGPERTDPSMTGDVGAGAADSAWDDDAAEVPLARSATSPHLERSSSTRHTSSRLVRAPKSPPGAAAFFQIGVHGELPGSFLQERGFRYFAPLRGNC
jgi:hypothetical protein